MLSVCFRLASAIYGYLAFYMPTNCAVDWLRTPRGLKWAIPVALVATPAHLFAMSICVVIIQRGGPGYLNVLVMLFAWNAMKFAVMGGLSIPFGLRRVLRGHRWPRQARIHRPAGLRGRDLVDRGLVVSSSDEGA